MQPNGKESYHLTREGGHSHRRIASMPPTYRKEVETTLVSRAQIILIFRVERSAPLLIISDKMGLPGPRRVVGAGSGIANKGRLKPVTYEVGGAGDRRRFKIGRPDISSGDSRDGWRRAGCRVLAWG